MLSSSPMDMVVFPISDVSQQSDRPPTDCKFEWSGLPKDLLELIFLRLRHAADLIRIGAVCKQWRSVVNTIRHKPLCPLLLLDNDEGSAFYDLFDFSKNKIQGTRLYPTDQFKRGRFTNSCNGWLVRMEYPVHSGPIHLLNPFTRVQIQLPPASAFEGPMRARFRIYLGMTSFLRKAVVSSTPLDPKCAVLAIYSLDMEVRLVFCSPGDTTWKTLKSEAKHFVDIIYFMDRFYALGRSKELFHCDISSDEPKAVQIALPEPEEQEQQEQEQEPEPEPEWPQVVGGPRGHRGPCGLKTKSYLVDWYGDLLMVVRHTVFNKIYVSKTTMFKVFKFDFGRGRWDEIDSLGGGGSIFVSYSAMAVLSIEDFPEFRSNCIYFTDDDHEKRWSDLRDTGVFSLSTKECKPSRLISGIWPPPFLWISPDLCTIKEV